MGGTTISPDELILFEWGFVRISVTLVSTWAVMLLMGLGSWLLTRRFTSGPHPSRAQLAVEAVVEGMRRQIAEIGGGSPDRYLGFVGTLFLFIVVSNVLGVLVPGFVPATASLSTTAALALCVLAAVPAYGIASRGVVGYLRHYTQPSPVMLPFNLIGELSRTLALAVRLFGNVMSGAKIVAVLVAVVPLFLPVVFRALGLLTGVIQAYIFAVLAMVYIAAGVRTEDDTTQEVHHG